MKHIKVYLVLPKLLHISQADAIDIARECISEYKQHRHFETRWILAHSDELTTCIAETQGDRQIGDSPDPIVQRYADRLADIITDALLDAQNDLAAGRS